MCIIWALGTVNFQPGVCNDPILGFYLFNCFINYLIVWCVLFIGLIGF
jgi:hypothetical protein